MFTVRQESDRLEAMRLLVELGADNSDVLEWTVRESLDTRKGVVIVENGLFTSEAALQAFRKSDKHRRTGERLSQISEWTTADYAEPTHRS